MTREPEETDPLAPVAATLRNIASLIEGDSDEVTAVLIVAVVGPNRMFQRAFINGYAAADLLVMTMDMVDMLRADMRGVELPMPPIVRAIASTEDP